MGCEFLQAMAEEDEEINVHNEETFGMDIDAQDTTGDMVCSLQQFSEAPPPPPPPPPDLKPVSSRKAASPLRQKPPYPPRVPPGQRGRGRGQKGRLARDVFDPCVMRAVEGRPSLKSLDSSIVDCGFAMHKDAFKENMMPPPYRQSRKPSGSILQDSAIVCVIGHRGRGQPTNSTFLDFPCPPSSFGGRRGEARGSYPTAVYGQRGGCHMQAPLIPGTPVFPRQQPTPRQFVSLDRADFMFSMSALFLSAPQPLTPKMMQPRFGSNSPRPSSFYSPSSNPVRPFSRYPGPVTQLHPQHERLLSQKRCMFQRKSQGVDPYSNLMTAKEKEWIIRLQMIQLQSENPYLEDYYYQEYYRRIEAKMSEEELGIRGKREPPKLTTPYITKMDAYTPVVHIEGSLGQVAVSTCYSPRRAIVAVHAVQTQGPTEEQKDTRQQWLEVLSKIEKLFIILLEVEEMERLRTRVLPEAEELRLRKKSEMKVDHIYSQLQHHKPPNSGGEFLPFLAVSKGKKLIARLLPFLKQDSAMQILCVVTCNLPTLMSRDADEALPVLYPPLRSVIATLTFSQLIAVLKDLMSSESLSTYECLTLTCQNRFGLSLLYALLSHGEKLLSSGAPLEPSIGDFEIWTDTVFQVAGQLSQCSLAEPLLLPSNLLTLFCRYLDKRTVHQLKNNLESAPGHLALPS
ncbi:protein PAT1 homolog 2 [Salarias fasciatus]|uniref:protein PAT1 homolog 2 n=1 Tax=Salarias fasciatus TaxID=181472 RepID=UPI001176B2E6|nr:protein PAT1 homolog 2 [Salarias fasciatus]